MHRARDRSGAWTLGAALVAHLVLLAFLPLARHSTSKEAPQGWTEIDLEQGAPNGKEGQPGAKTTVGTKVESHAQSRTYAGHEGTTQTLSHVDEISQHPDNIEPETHDEASSGKPSTLFVDPSGIGLAGPGSYRIDMAKQRAELSESEQVADNIHHAVMDPIHAHESRNGTLADGPIVAELEKTTRHLAGSPFEGRAVFAFRIDELGLVVSASVEDVSGDRLEWEAVAKETFNALAQKRLVLPAGSKGVSMRVELTSKVVLPSGARHALTVGSPAVDALGHVLKGQFDQPAETPGLVGASFDLSDIGAHPMRVVGARVLSETAL